MSGMPAKTNSGCGRNRLESNTYGSGVGMRHQAKTNIKCLPWPDAISLKKIGGHEKLATP